MGAVELHARANADFAGKLDQTGALLRQVVADHPRPRRTRPPAWVQKTW